MSHLQKSWKTSAGKKKALIERKMRQLFLWLAGRVSFRRLKPYLPIPGLVIAMGSLKAQQFEPYVTDPFGLEQPEEALYFPSFVDLDGDGDLDFFSLQDEPDEDFAYRAYFKENTGDAQNPDFSGTGQAGAFGLEGIEVELAFHTFGDLDDDGDLDLLVFWDYNEYTYQTSFLYFENTGSAQSAAFVEQDLITLEFPLPPDFSFLELADMDDDGDLDLIGSWRDYNYYINSLVYFENIGSPELAQFGQGNMDIFDDLSGGNAVLFFPEMGDLDRDGDLDMLATKWTVAGGGYETAYLYYENTGSTSEPHFAAAVTQPFGLQDGMDEGEIHTLSDLDGDGDLDLLSNTYTINSAGYEFRYRENRDLTPVQDEERRMDALKVYPVPASQFIQMQLPEELSGKELFLTFSDYSGRVLHSFVYQGGAIDIRHYPTGIYYMEIGFEDHKLVREFVKK